MRKIFISLLLLHFTATSHKPKETFKDIVLYVTDPNGIFLFPDPRDIGKRIAVPYKTKLISLGTEKFSIPSKNNEEETKYFEKLLYKEKIYYVKEDNSNRFIRLEPPNSDLYTYTQVPQATIYSLPFKDSKVVKRLPEFSMLEVMSISHGNIFDSYRFDEYSWSEIKFANNVTGFILKHEILKPDSLVITEQSLKNKVIDKTGFFQVTVDKPEFFATLENIEQAKSIDSADKDYFPKKGMFTQTMSSLVKNEIRYYQIERLNLREALYWQAYSGKKVQDSEKEFWISEKEGRFFSNEEFTKYSFQNSKYKKDSYLFKIFEWKHGDAVNYDTLKLWKFFSKKYNSEFYQINFQYGTDGDFKYLIIERKGSQLKEIFFGQHFGIEDIVYTKIIGDIDGDGFPEFLGHYVTRGWRVDYGDDGGGWYTFKNGEIKPFKPQLPDECNSEFDGKYLSCFSITENKDEDGNYKTEKKLLARYKFIKGKLYKEAAKDKWEEVKSERE